MFRIITLGAALVMAGLVISLASGYSVAQLLIFDGELVAVAGLDFRLIVFGYTLIFAGLLPGLRLRTASKPDAASGPARE